MRTLSPILRILDDRVRAHPAVGADLRRSQQLHEGLDDSIRADFYVGVDHAGFGIEDRHARGHQFLALVAAHFVVEFDQFSAGVAAENFGRVFGFDRHHALAGLAQGVRHVGEVILGVRVVSFQPPDVGKQRLHRKRVEARINLVNLALHRRARLLFNDGLNFVGLQVRGPANDAAVAGGIFQLRAQDGHRSLFLTMKVAQLADGVRGDERSVAGEHDDVVVSGEGLAGAHERVTGAALRFLNHELNASTLNRLADARGLVTDNGVNVFRRDDLLGGGDYMRQQRLAADFVQDFGQFRLQPRALARGHDRDGGSGFAVNSD